MKFNCISLAFEVKFNCISQKPQEKVVPPTATATSCSLVSEHVVQEDDAVLADALATFERQAGDKGDRKGGAEEGQPGPSQSKHRDAAPPSPLPIPVPGLQPERTTDAALQPRASTVRSAAVTAVQSEVIYEGWHKMWESDPNGLPKVDKWLKEDEKNGLFKRAASFHDKHSQTKWRNVLKNDRMWFNPPEMPGVLGGTVPSADSFFHSQVFFWRPVGVWHYSLRCPRPECPARENKNAFLYHCGYSKTVRRFLRFLLLSWKIKNISACSLPLPWEEVM